MYLVGLVCIINIHTLMIQTKLRCGGVVNNLISNGLLLHVSLPLKKNYTDDYLAKLQAISQLSAALCGGEVHTKCTRQPPSCL